MTNGATANSQGWVPGIDDRRLHDPVSELAPRFIFMGTVERLLRDFHRGGPAPILLAIEIDHFWQRHVAMPLPEMLDLVRSVATFLKSHVPDPTALMRSNGGLFYACVTDEDAAERLGRAGDMKVTLGHQTLRISTTIGRAVATPEIVEPVLLTWAASVALDQARQVRAGKRSYAYDDKLAERLRRRHLIEQHIHSALEGRRVDLHVQPKVVLQSRTVIGCEALMRLKDADGRIIPPDQVVEVAEQTGLIADLDRLIVDQALAICSLFREAGLPWSMAINVGPDLLRDTSFVHQLAQDVDHRAVPRDMVEIEIVEAAADLEIVGNRVGQLVDAGFKVALDDFGRDYSNLQRLTTLPVSSIKVDRSFTSRVVDERRIAAILRSVVAMTRELGLDLVVEGIETEAEHNLLETYGAAYGQGYLYGKAIPPIDAMATHP